MVDEEDEEEHIEDWSQDKLRERSKELQLVDENGVCKTPKVELLNNRNCDSRVEELVLSEVEDESKSASKSTTSDSQVSVKSYFSYPSMPTTASPKLTRNINAN